MQKTHRFFKAALVSTVFVFVCAFSAAPVQAKATYVRLGCGEAGGSWFTMVGGLTALFNKQIPDVNVSAVSSGGSVALMRLLKNRDLEATFSHTLTAYDQWNGVGDFEKDGSWKGMRMMSGMYESVHHWVVREDSGIKGLADLAGKRVNVGSAGSGSAANSIIILKALGLDGQVKMNHLSFGDAGRAVGDGQMDCLGMSGAPMSAVVTLEASHKIRILDMTDEEFKKVLAQSPFYYKSVLPAGTYKSWQKDTPCVAFQVYWITHDKLSPELVYDMLKVAFDPKNKDYLTSVHKQFKGMTPALEPMRGMAIPLHPGAVKFWKEQGKTVPAELIPPEMK